MEFVKIDNSILGSDLIEDPVALSVWLMVLLHCNLETGVFFESSKRLSAISCGSISVEQIDECLKRWSKPNARSRDRMDNPENKGRRLEQVLDEGEIVGYKVVNWHKYGPSKERLKEAERKREYRKKKKEETELMEEQSQDKRSQSQNVFVEASQRLRR